MVIYRSALTSSIYNNEMLWNANLHQRHLMLQCRAPTVQLPNKYDSDLYRYADWVWNAVIMFIYELLTNLVMSYSLVMILHYSARTIPINEEESWLKIISEKMLRSLKSTSNDRLGIQSNGGLNRYPRENRGVININHRDVGSED